MGCRPGGLRAVKPLPGHRLAVKLLRGQLHAVPLGQHIHQGQELPGKSATVKHLLTLPGLEELRLIEADKENLGGLPALIRSLDGRRSSTPCRWASISTRARNSPLSRPWNSTRSPKRSAREVFSRMVSERSTQKDMTNDF